MKNKTLTEQLDRTRKIMGLINEAPTVAGPGWITKLFGSLVKGEREAIISAASKKLGRAITGGVAELSGAVNKGELKRADLLDIITTAFKSSHRNLDILVDALIEHDPALFNGLKKLGGSDVPLDRVLKTFPELEEIPEELRNLYFKRIGYDPEGVIGGGSTPKPSVGSVSSTTPPIEVDGILDVSMKKIISGKLKLGDIRKISENDINKILALQKLKESKEGIKLIRATNETKTKILEYETQIKKLDVKLKEIEVEDSNFNLKNKKDQSKVELQKQKLELTKLKASMVGDLGRWIWRQKWFILAILILVFGWKVIYPLIDTIKSGGDVFKYIKNGDNTATNVTPPADTVKAPVTNVTPPTDTVKTPTTNVTPPTDTVKAPATNKPPVDTVKTPTPTPKTKTTPEKLNWD